jgi:hypothetical protein
MMPNHTYRLQAAAVAACLGLLGCSACDAKSDAPSVATARSSGQASTGDAAGSAAAVDASRPQLRLDSTDEERWALTQTWYRCLRDNGAPMVEIPPQKVDGTPGAKPGDLLPDTSGTAGKFNANPRTIEAVKQCAAKEPLEPAELDPRRNPHYAQQWDTMVACMRATGGEVTESKADDGIHNDFTFSPPKGKEADVIVKECQRKAFGNGR